MALQPRLDSGAKITRERPHLRSFAWRRRTGSLVVRDVALPPERVELPNGRCLELNRERERFDRSHVLRLTCDTIACRGERRCRGLQSSVVSEAELAVFAQPRDGAVLEVTIGDGQQRAYLVARRRVGCRPPERRPVAQAHMHFRSETASAAS